MSDDASFQFQEAANHWRQQLHLASVSGKNVIVFLPQYEEIWVDSGERQYSGTGKNRETTRVVNLSSNYAMLPILAESVVASQGSVMKLTDQGKVLQPYWNDFGALSEYRVIFNELKVAPIVVTRVGDRPVGCIFKFGSGPGRIVALPTLAKYDQDPSRLDVLYGSDAHVEWQREDKRFGQKLINALLATDNTLRADAATTPPPAWTSDDQYTLQKERELREAILKADRQIETATAKKSKLTDELTEEGKLRRLLYETGKALELAIIDALQILGFSAEGFREGDSEFDAVFASAEGRFIGEAEGKDNKSIGIDKLRQLQMNVQEDLAREEVSEPAMGVLFGNAYRLLALAERSTDFFTEKCLKAAARSGTALVKTTDLFTAARYIRESGDSSYAEACRRAMLEQGGSVVSFPTLPIETVIPQDSVARPSN